MKSGHFETHVHGDDINVVRHFESAEGTIDLNLTFRPSVDRLTMTLGQIHVASLRIAIHRLQELLDRSLQTEAAPGNPAG